MFGDGKLARQACRVGGLEESVPRRENRMDKGKPRDHVAARKHEELGTAGA